MFLYHIQLWQKHLTTSNLDAHINDIHWDIVVFGPHKHNRSNYLLINWKCACFMVLRNCQRVDDVCKCCCNFTCCFQRFLGPSIIMASTTTTFQNIFLMHVRVCYCNTMNGKACCGSNAMKLYPRGPQWILWWASSFLDDSKQKSTNKIFSQSASILSLGSIWQHNEAQQSLVATTLFDFLIRNYFILASTIMRKTIAKLYLWKLFEGTYLPKARFRCHCINNFDNTKTYHWT